MFIFFKKTATTSVLIYVILQELVSNHRLSKKFIINKDKLFISKFWRIFTAKLEIKHKLLTAYHSQMNEQSEWMNQTVNIYLHHYVNQKQNNWIQLLSMAQYAYNNTRNEITEITSFFINYKYHSKMWRQSQTHLIKSQWVMIDVIKLKQLHENLNKWLQTQCRKSIMIKSYKMKKKVYLQTNNIKIKQKSKKLNHKSIESFTILRNIKNLSYKLKLSMKIKIHSVFHAFMFQWCDQDISIQITEILIEINNKYKVETILEKRTISEKSYYFIKWKKYNISENIWKFRDNLKNCVRMLQCFEKRWR